METNRFSIIYSFKIFEGKEEEFIRCWIELTQLIYEFEGSYGSKLHKVDAHLFIAYAQWPDRETFEQSGARMPEIAQKYRKEMRECCEEIKSEFELNSIVVDLIEEKQHPDFKPANS